MKKIWNLIKGLFRKNEEPVVHKKMDLSQYKMKMTVKSVCMFEKLSGKSFFSFDDEDIPLLLYSTFYCSNDVEIKFETFLGIMDNQDIANWAVTRYTDILAVMQQFKVQTTSGETTEQKQPQESVTTVTDLANTLIVDYGVDAHYVMYEMSLWEIEKMYEVVQTKIQNHYEEERLWAYINVMPHIDGKKIKGPEKLLPFPWEQQNRKKKAETELKNNEYAVKHTIGMNIDDIINGAR